MILFEKIQHGKIKLEKEKKLQNIFKPNLNEISRGRFAQVNAGNTSENLLNEIRQITYSLYWAK